MLSLPEDALGIGVGDANDIGKAESETLPGREGLNWVQFVGRLLAEGAPAGACHLGAGPGWGEGLGTGVRAGLVSLPTPGQLRRRSEKPALPGWEPASRICEPGLDPCGSCPELTQSRSQRVTLPEASSEG